MNLSKATLETLQIQIQQSDTFGNYLFISNLLQFILYPLAALLAITIFLCQRHKLCQKIRELKAYNLSLKLRQSFRTAMQHAYSPSSPKHVPDPIPIETIV